MLYLSSQLLNTDRSSIPFSMTRSYKGRVFDANLPRPRMMDDGVIAFHSHFVVFSFMSRLLVPKICALHLGLPDLVNNNTIQPAAKRNERFLS